MKIEIEMLRRASSAADKIKSIDSTIKDMGNVIESNAQHYGERVRNIFGSNRLSQLTDSHLGEVVFCAIVNALLDERAGLVSEFADLVEFPKPPCVRQEPSAEAGA